VYNLIPLEQLPSGSSARVGELMGRPEQVQRLRELGLRHGERVEMVRSGRPCIVRLCGNKLCFRDCDALNVLVTPEEVA